MKLGRLSVAAADDQPVVMAPALPPLPVQIQTPSPSDSAAPLAVGAARHKVAASGAAVMQNRISLARLARADERGVAHSPGFQREMMRVAANGFSQAAQRELVAKLEQRFPNKVAPSKEELEGLADVLEDFRAASRGKKADFGPMAAFFRSRGFYRLGVQGKLPHGHAGYQLDQPQFQAALRRLAPGENNPRREAEVKALRGMVRTLVDHYDIAWAQRQIVNAKKAGRLDEATAGELLGEVSRKMPNTVPVMDVADALRSMRKQGFSKEATDAYCRMLDGAKGDSKVLFFARRIALRSIDSALAKEENQTPVAQARLTAAKQRLSGYFGNNTAGMFDSYAEQRKLFRLKSEGRLGEGQFYALRAAAITSSCRGDFERGVAYAQQTLGVSLSMQELYYDAVAEVVEVITKNMDDDERDSEGRIIETAEERELRHRLEQQQIEDNQREEPEKASYLTQRAGISARAQSAMSAMGAANGPAAKSDAAGKLAAALDEADELDRPNPTT